MLTEIWKCCVNVRTLGRQRDLEDTVNRRQREREKKLGSEDEIEIFDRETDDGASDLEV